jgi:hypothetical protein
VLCAGADAAARQPEDCPRWFPDLRCDRTGRYQGFVEPVTLPYLFEDPFITTGLQLVGIWHSFPDSSVFQGGQAGVLALQARVAVTDRLALIATRDGIMFLDPRTELGGADVLDDQTGFMDIALGAKYALVELPEHDFILTPALRFQVPVGQQDVLQGNGDGLLIPSFSFAKGFGRFHVIGSFGANIPFVDGGENNSNVFWNAHFDYALAEHFVPFVEMNGMNYVDSGDGSTRVSTRLGTLSLDTVQAALGTGRFDGYDVANLGSRGIDGDNTVTLALGARVPIARRWSIGAAWESFLVGERDIFKQRVTLALSLSF